MNYKFKHKPVTIEAFQMTREHRFSNEIWPVWLYDAWQRDRAEPNALYPTEFNTARGTLSVNTLEGQHLVSWNDWIVQGVSGQLYPVKPDIFAKKYAEVFDDDLAGMNDE